MVDKNGVEMKTGDVVLISGAFFKNDNGLWFIERSPGDPSWCGSSYSLTKLKRNEAHAWNAEHAEIEVVKIADRSAIADHFMGLAKELDPYIEREVWDWGENHPEVLRHKEVRSFYASVAKQLKK